MRICIKNMALAVGFLGLAVACVEPSLAGPNSDEGHLYVDLEQSLAVGWDAEVLIMGPPTGEQHCDDVRGCYPDSEEIEMLDVTSTDPSVVAVEGFEADRYGESQAVRLDLQILEEGEASLEFQFTVDGRQPPADDESDGGESANQTSDTDQNGEEEDVDGDGDSGVWSDSFGVEARQVSSVQLSRTVGESDSSGPYSLCPETGPGTYLMNGLDDYDVELHLEKLDEQGNRLRGSGKLPFEIEPEGAVELEISDEVGHPVIMKPNQFGTVTVAPTGAGKAFKASFASLAEVSSLETRVFRLNDEGIRAAEVTGLVVDSVYEVSAKPEIDGDAPLCGGAVETTVESLTPATCEAVGEMADTGNPAITASHGGECQLRIAVGDELVEDWVYSVEYGW